MIPLLISLLMMSDSAGAFAKLFQTQSLMGLEQHRFNRQQEATWRQMCLLKKKTDRFLWPCMLKNEPDYWDADIVEYCQQEVKRVTHLTDLPPDTLAKRFQQSCWQSIEYQRRILLYKRNRLGLGSLEK